MIPPDGAALTEREDGNGHGSGQDADQRSSCVHAAPLALELDVEGLELSEFALEALDVELVETLRLVDVLESPLAQIADGDPRR